MKLGEVFPSNYIKAADLQGRDVTVVIRDAQIEKLGEDQKLVLYFQGKQKGLVTNKTNANRVAYLYGDDTDDWIGKEIVLFTDMVDFQGRTVEAVRIKAPANRNAQPQRQLVVSQRDGYQLSTTQPVDDDPIEEAVGNARRGSMKDQLGDDPGF